MRRWCNDRIDWTCVILDICDLNLIPGGGVYGTWIYWLRLAETHAPLLVDERDKHEVHKATVVIRGCRPSPKRFRTAGAAFVLQAASGENALWACLHHGGEMLRPAAVAKPVSTRRSTGLIERHHRKAHLTHEFGVVFLLRRSFSNECLGCLATATRRAGAACMIRLGVCPACRGQLSTLRCHHRI